MDSHTKPEQACAYCRSSPWLYLPSCHRNDFYSVYYWSKDRQQHQTHCCINIPLTWVVTAHTKDSYVSHPALGSQPSTLMLSLQRQSHYVVLAWNSISTGQVCKFRDLPVPACRAGTKKAYATTMDGFLTLWLAASGISNFPENITTVSYPSGKFLF